MMAAPSNSCYCCLRPSTPAVGMDIDAALMELGMLSSVTDSRQQYLAERSRPRVRQVSEPSTSTSLEPDAASLTSACMTPTNSPNKGTYQIVQLNPQFVTSLSSGINAIEMTRSASKDSIDFGTRYSQESLDRESKSNRLSRNKVSRLRRFRKPYEVPWLQRHSIDVCYSGESSSGSQSEHSTETVAATAAGAPPPQTPPIELEKRNLCLFNTVTPAEKSRDAATEKPLCSSSNASTPEKSNHHSQGSTVPRSKSLDDLDFAKLRLAEAENHNFIVQKKEIDSVSQHLQNLNVNE